MVIYGNAVVARLASVSSQFLIAHGNWVVEVLKNLETWPWSWLEAVAPSICVLIYDNTISKCAPLLQLIHT